MSTERTRARRRGQLRGALGWMALMMAVAIGLTGLAFPLHARKSRKKVEVSGVGLYRGNVDPAGQLSGRGKMTYLNGDVYDGEWADGHRSGHGRLKTRSGDVYEGTWADDQLTHGKATYKGMGWYEGYFADLLPDGWGVRSQGGHTVEGRWTAGQPDGIMKDTPRRGKPLYSLYRNGIPTALTVTPDLPQMGIDISRYQPDIVWPHLYFYNEGQGDDYRTHDMAFGSVRPVEFVIIKATEGGDHVDPMMQAHGDNALRHNYPRGFYHFYNTTSSASANAANFISRVSLRDNDLPPILDIEVDGEQVDSLLHWMQLVERHYGRKPMIYTNERYYRQYVEGTALEQYPLWYARYGRRDIDRGAPLLQFTESGRIDGVRGHTVDINEMRRGLTVDDLR